MTSDNVQLFFTALMKSMQTGEPIEFTNERRTERYLVLFSVSGFDITYIYCMLFTCSNYCLIALEAL